MVQIGCAKALGFMGPAEAKPAIPRLLKTFDESKDEWLRLVAMQALIAIQAEPKELERRLRPLAASTAAQTPSGRRPPDGTNDTLGRLASQYVAEGGGKAGTTGLLDLRVGEYAFDAERFAWGSPSAGVQLGVYLPPAEKPKTHDRLHLLVAVRNVGNRPVVLPMYFHDLLGLDIRLSESPDLLWRTLAASSPRVARTAAGPGDRIAANLHAAHGCLRPS